MSSRPLPSPSSVSIGGDPLISVRIVHIDYYTHALHNYSSSTPFQAARLTHASPQTGSKLPVVRIFGTTPAGQRCCVHVHAVRPYLHIEAPTTLSPPDLFRYSVSLRKVLESSLRSAFAPTAEGAQPSTTAGDPLLSPYIADIEPVAARSIYGFHSHPVTFLKVTTYAPTTVSRIATLLTHRALPPPFDNLILPHSAHIPFTLQFLTDYSLAGMDYLHLSSCKFRQPLPKLPIKSSTTNGAEEFVRAPLQKRTFIHGLHLTRPNLFWSFNVAKRSTSPVELDIFGTDILNAAQPSTSSEINITRSFVNRTLAVLWEEERLRTGIPPPRPVNPERPVVPGGHLSPSDARVRLRELLRAPSSQEAGILDTERLSGENMANDEENTATLTPLSSVINYLDASLPHDEDEGSSNDAYEAQDDDERIDDAGEVDEEPLSIEQTWRDIAACTQNQHDDAVPVTRVPTVVLGQASTPSASSPSVPSLPHESPSTPFTPRTLRVLSQKSRRARTPAASSSSQTVKIVRPLAPAVRASSIKSSREVLVEWRSPFYSGVTDYTRAIAFGSTTASIRRPGANGFPPFPLLFQTTHSPSAILNFVTPACKPPTLAKLRASKAARAPDTKALPGIRVAIDSAGRLVRLRDGLSTHELSLTPLPAPAPSPEHDSAAIDVMLSDDNDGFMTTPTEEPIPNLMLSRTIHGTESAEAGDDTSSNLVLSNRPLSPKYDETFQFTLHQLSNSRGQTSHAENISKQMKRNDELADSARLNNPNSMISLSESPHKCQNLSFLSIEILAKSYSDKLPDPAQNELLAVCTVFKVDDATSEQEKQSCAVLVVRPSVLLSRAYHVISFDSEMSLLDGLAAHIQKLDPDLLVGFEIQTTSIGYILERAQAIGHPFGQMASRWVKGSGQLDAPRTVLGQPNAEAAMTYFQRKGADMKITGRHIISLWRLVRTEVKLSAYSREVVAAELFQTTFPKHSNRTLESWFLSSHTDRAARYIFRLAMLNVAIIDKLNVLSRTGELARVYGIDFMSVLTRGSQFRVESMMRRVARARGFLLLSAAREEVFKQPAVEALPLVMEPNSGLYVDPVIVLDFQSLYPSVIIAHNLCFSTMLGNANRINSWDEARRTGVLPSYMPPAVTELGGADNIEKHVFIASNGEMFVDATVRQGILPQMLQEILETRIMVKTAMKKVVGDEATRNLLNARQFGLKMIANVTYGYASASFSGRMPCAGLADAIVQCGRDALEQICDYVDNELQAETGATIVYGDTDSLFVQVRGATREEAFKVGERIVAQANKMFPAPMALKLEKVYQPCVLQTKKRYVGYSYESPTQAIPVFDAKGIETVRRDTCPLVQKALERSLRLLFETKDLTVVKRDLRRLCGRLFTERVPIADFIFRREVRLGSYKEGHLPPAAIVATKAIECDPRTAPRHGERVPFVVVYDRPGALLKDCVMAPETFLSMTEKSGTRLNITYYITKQLIPALDRVFSLIGVRVASWYADFPRTTFITPVHAMKHGVSHVARKGQQSVLSMFYATSVCSLCRRRCRNTALCQECTCSPTALQASRFLLEERKRQIETCGRKLLSECRLCAQADFGMAVECCNVSCKIADQIRTAERHLLMTEEALYDDRAWGVKDTSI